MRHPFRRRRTAAPTTNAAASRAAIADTRWWAPLAVLILVTSAGCLGLWKDPTGGLLRGQLQEWAWQQLEPAAVDRLGVLAFQMRMRTLERSRNAADLALVEKVKGRILDAVAQTPYADTARKFDWDVVVVRGDLPDAVAFPGGKIIVWTGLLRYLGSARPAGPPENQLAVALGHEVVHALARHAAKRIDKEVRQAYALAMQGKDLSDAGADPAAAAALMAAMGVHYEGTVVLPFTSEQESEADHHGLLITARAGYEPAEAVRFWEQIKQRNQGRTPPEFFTKHPDYDMRIEQLKGWMAEARQHYRSPAATLSLASGADGCSNSG